VLGLALLYYKLTPTRTVVQAPSILPIYLQLLSHQTPQKGEDKDGLRGFLYSDIKDEIARSRKSQCEYCGESGASMRCATCKIKFHLPCGLIKSSVPQFKDKFPTFCAIHRPVQVVDRKITLQAKKDKPSCSVCMEPVYVSEKNELNIDVLWSPCCKKTWHHRLCIQVSEREQSSSLMDISTGLS